MSNAKNTGNWGEQQAVKYLKENAYQILETNWRCRRWEIDIIAKTNDAIVFVEVKTRGSDEFGEPESFVSLKKQRLVIAAANHYIQEKDIDLEARFDIISILVNNNITTVKHLQDAFYPTLK